jgi:hypothetical protein
MPRSAKNKADRKEHPKSYTTNLDNMKLLASGSAFKEIVAETRKVLGIPPEGIKTDSELKAWSERMLEESDRVFESPEFDVEMDAIYKARDSGEIDYEEFCRRINLHHEKVPLNYKSARIQFIIEKFGLPENYRDHIETYIVRGKITAPYHNFVLGPWTEPTRGKKWSEIRHVPVTFYTIPTAEDIRLVKQEVERMAKHRKLPKYAALSNIDRDLEIEDWHRHGERFDSVTFAPYRTTASEIAQDKLGSPSKADQVRGIVRDLKKARKKRFGSREKD